MQGVGEAARLEGVREQSGLGVPWPGHLAGRATASLGGRRDSEASLFSWLNITEQEKSATSNHTWTETTQQACDQTNHSGKGSDKTK